MLEHGGRVLQAARNHGIPADRWLDLSTGINPHGWPVPVLPPGAWARLPESEDGLLETAAEYYGSPWLLPVAGSQVAIQALPAVRPPGRVGVPAPGYSEHARAWQRAGHEVIPLPPEQLLEAGDLDTVVVINPNNPSGHGFRTDQLLALHQRLQRHKGWLVVDEAFVDATPAYSLAGHSPRPGLVVLRSLGKFFGLAGARVGFALAEPALLASLEQRLGPWRVAGPSRWVARAALADRAWQRAMGPRLRAGGERLARLLARHGLTPHGGTALFQWVVTEQAPEIHCALARLGILTRLFDDPPSLRLGLPAGEAQWRRLEQALKALQGSSPW